MKNFLTKTLIATSLLSSLSLIAQTGSETMESTEPMITTTETILESVKATDLPSAAQAVAEYIKMEEGHKARWLKFHGDSQSEKFALITKHHMEKAELIRKNVIQLGNDGDAQAYLSNTLEQMIALHKRQMEEWKALCTKHEEKARQLYQAEKTELEQFEESHE